MSFRLTSAAFREGETIPVTYTADGANQSPPLAWSEPPDGTASLALVCEDPDAPRGTWVHWVLFNLPADLRSLDEDASAIEAAIEGKNDFGDLGYGGPAPPRGKPHRYYFKLYAVACQVKLPAGASRAQLSAALNGHVLAEASLMGKYQR